MGVKRRVSVAMDLKECRYQVGWQRRKRETSGGKGSRTHLLPFPVHVVDRRGGIIHTTPAHISVELGSVSFWRVSLLLLLLLSSRDKI